MYSTVTVNLENGFATIGSRVEARGAAFLAGVFAAFGVITIDGAVDAASAGATSSGGGVTAASSAEAGSTSTSRTSTGSSNVASRLRNARRAAVWPTKTSLNAVESRYPGARTLTL